MGRMDQWLELVIGALEYHQGEASLTDLYQWVMQKDSELWSNYTDPKAQARKALYLHSSDADIYDESKEDLFYSVEGKGDGFWGLRSKSQNWTGNFWWVCQGKTYKDARDSGYIYAPEKGENGATREHWRRVSDVRKGDIILHWSGAIMAIGVAVEDAKLGPRPHSTNSDNLWDDIGYSCKIKYYEFTPKISSPELTNDIREKVRETMPVDGPFNVKLGCKQAYMSKVPHFLATWINDNFADRIAEQIPGWNDLCNSKQSFRTPKSINLKVESSNGLDYYLSHKPQIILAGPPGTSKTWSATEYVEKQMGGKRFEKAENEYAESYWSIVQFHPSYGYEDFISGVKAETVNGNLTFEQKKGIFLKMAIAAKQNPDNNYYLIIDEINRGVLGRIFGELILTLEYRGLEVHLPDEDEPLNIPENLYLIGTMNTADRNIALVDHALRRRFLIVEMLPDATQINDYHDTKKNSNKIRNLTLEAFRITQNAFYKTGTQEYDPDMNGYNMQDYAVGHTYFMADNNDQLSMNIKHQVIPLLGEYQREGVITKAAFEKVKSELQRFG